MNVKIFQMLKMISAIEVIILISVNNNYIKMWEIEAKKHKCFWRTDWTNLKASWGDEKKVTIFLIFFCQTLEAAIQISFMSDDFWICYNNKIIIWVSCPKSRAEVPFQSIFDVWITWWIKMLTTRLFLFLLIT